MGTMPSSCPTMQLALRAIVVQSFVSWRCRSSARQSHGPLSRIAVGLVSLTSSRAPVTCLLTSSRESTFVHRRHTTHSELKLVRIAFQLSRRRSRNCSLKIWLPKRSYRLSSTLTCHLCTSSSSVLPTSARRSNRLFKAKPTNRSPIPAGQYTNPSRIGSMSPSLNSTFGPRVEARRALSQLQMFVRRFKSVFSCLPLPHLH